MARPSHVVALVLVSARFLFAQAPAFEVASVKPNISGSSAAASSTPPAGTIHVLNTPARMLIVNAYGLKPFQVVGGPAWLESERYDIIAKPPDKTPPNMIGLMFRTLMEERFALKFHMDTREQPIYELVLARDDGRLGPGLVKSQTDCAAIDAARAGGRADSAPPASGNGPPPCRMRVAIRDTGGALDVGGRPLAPMLNTFGIMANRPVVDRTGLTGPFDVELRWSETTLSTNAGIPAAVDAPSFFVALQEQLGLRLRPSRGPVEVLVIDHVQRPEPD